MSLRHEVHTSTSRRGRDAGRLGAGRLGAGQRSAFSSAGATVRSHWPAYKHFTARASVSICILTPSLLRPGRLLITLQSTINTIHIVFSSPCTGKGRVNILKAGRSHICSQPRMSGAIVSCGRGEEGQGATGVSPPSRRGEREKEKIRFRLGEGAGPLSSQRATFQWGHRGGG